MSRPYTNGMLSAENVNLSNHSHTASVSIMPTLASLLNVNGNGSSTMLSKDQIQANITASAILTAHHLSSTGSSNFYPVTPIKHSIHSNSIPSSPLGQPTFIIPPSMAIPLNSDSPSLSLSSTAQSSQLNTPSSSVSAQQLASARDIAAPYRKSRSRGKNKQKHNESESRRRDRLRLKFMELKSAAESEKKDRIAILAVAIERLKERKIHIQNIEQQNAYLLTKVSHSNSIQLPTTSSTKSTPKHERNDSNSSCGKGLENIGGLSSGRFPFLNALPAAFIGLDGNFLDANASFLALTGFTNEMLLKSTIFSITAQHELLVTLLNLNRLLHGEANSCEFDRLCVTTDGKAIPVHVTIAMVKSVNNPDYFTCIFTVKDMTNATVNLNVPNALAQSQSRSQVPTTVPSLPQLQSLNLPLATSISPMNSTVSFPPPSLISPNFINPIFASSQTNTLQQLLQQQQQQQQQQSHLMHSALASHSQSLSLNRF